VSDDDFLGYPDVFGPDPGRDKPGRYHRDGQITERIAAYLVAPRTGSQRAKVLAAFRTAGEYGCTDNELHFHFGIGARPHVPGTRREELIADGWPIVDSGRRRMTDTGTPAIVWVLDEAALARIEVKPKPPLKSATAMAQT
jgi:hypothetical protein